MTTPKASYRDFAGAKEDDLAPLLDAQALKYTNFPEKLHLALDEMEENGLGDVCSWQPHGRCFKIHDQKRFEKEVLPNWFQQSKIASFKRQLNIYDFIRIPSGPDKRCYCHEMFLRGKMFLTKHIKLRKIKGVGVRKSVPKELIPDLYAFPPVSSASTPRSVSRSTQDLSQPVGFQQLPAVPESIASTPSGTTTPRSVPRSAQDPSPALQQKSRTRSRASRLSLHSLVPDCANTGSDPPPDSLLTCQNPLQFQPISGTSDRPPDMILRQDLSRSKSHHPCMGTSNRPPDVTLRLDPSRSKYNNLVMGNNIGNIRRCRPAVPPVVPPESVPDFLSMPVVRAEDTSLVDAARVPLHPQRTAISTLHKYSVLGSNVVMTTDHEGSDLLSQPFMGTSNPSPDRTLRLDVSRSKCNPCMGTSRESPNKLFGQDLLQARRKPPVGSNLSPHLLLAGQDPSRTVRGSNNCSLQLSHERPVLQDEAMSLYAHHISEANRILLSQLGMTIPAPPVIPGDKISSNAGIQQQR